ncbi:MAG: alpha/beta fold hydrolase [Phycisphaera sp.]|nr:alpha/beta fold hydrolase [Phycisphaera sp.]
MSLVLLLIAATLVVITALVIATIRESIRPNRRSTGWALGVGWPSDPEAVGVEFEEWTLDRPNGVRLPVWDVTGEVEEGPVLILVHGFGRSRLTWLPHLDEWRSRGSRVVMIDLRGHGDAMPDGAGLGDADVGDLVSLVRTVDQPEETEPRPPIVVVGRSLGATVAILAAAECDAIDGVMAVAPYETLRVPMTCRVALRGLPGWPALPIALFVLRLLGRSPRHTSEAARRLSVPLLVVQGDLDQISPEPGARAIADAASDSRFELVEGAGHGDHWDHEPERLDAALDDFLQAIRPSRTSA